MGARRGTEMEERNRACQFISYTGDKDLVFNYKNISNATIIKGGTHIMVFDKAKQINKLLKGILKKK
jgi:hypothetical protein